MCCKPQQSASATSHRPLREQAAMQAAKGTLSREGRCEETRPTLDSDGLLQTQHVKIEQWETWTYEVHIIPSWKYVSIFPMLLEIVSNILYYIYILLLLLLYIYIYTSFYFWRKYAECSAEGVPH